MPQFWSSFLKYIPYSVISGLIFPRILTSTGRLASSLTVIDVLAIPKVITCFNHGLTFWCVHFCLHSFLHFAVHWSHHI
ncbi:AzlD domain-containing protein [Heliorestis acidaminivorans]|uniref:AzlD domain-containing protein n=1 Tax=Heliorestis acidaminivorans TaxID=553427 RepID=A0A6I0EVQ9_9FIRM|nr:AzlD domain-containing protein [Heliorestis acidaminivorans]